MIGRNNSISIKRWDRIAWIISILVFILLLVMRRVKLDFGVDFGILPAIHAGINTLTACLLLTGYYFIRNGKITSHKRTMTSALALSLLFLMSYVLYHFTTAETSYGGEGSIRYLYYLLLITHIVLAAIILPFILLTFIRAWAGAYVRHKKMARWVYPIWLYVAITGPIVYLMLRPYYE